MIPLRNAGRPWTDLWLFDFKGSSRPFVDHHTSKLLGPEELERASRHASQTTAREFLASHVGLRSVLMEYGGDINTAFSIGPTGKPFLPGGPQFSLSRTRHAAIVAVSSSDVGIDLEYRRAVALSEPRVAEVSKLLRQVGGFGNLETLQIWTAMEAWVKHRGSSMRQFIESQTAMIEMAKDLEEGALALRPLDLPHELCGAVCTAAESVVTFLSL